MKKLNVGKVQGVQYVFRVQ